MGRPCRLGVCGLTALINLSVLRADQLSEKADRVGGGLLPGRHYGCTDPGDHAGRTTSVLRLGESRL